MLVLLKFWQFSSELTKTFSGNTESRVWIGTCNVNVWKSTKHKVHKIWRSLTFLQNSRKRAQLRYNFTSDHKVKTLGLKIKILDFKSYIFKFKTNLNGMKRIFVFLLSRLSTGVEAQEYVCLTSLTRAKPKEKMEFPT